MIYVNNLVKIAKIIKVFNKSRPGKVLGIKVKTKMLKKNYLMRLLAHLYEWFAFMLGFRLG